MSLTLPSTYPVRNQDDPWDSDAVNWAYEQPGCPEMGFQRFFELCRRQPGAVGHAPEKAVMVERFLKTLGVEQREEPFGKGVIVRLYRHDEAAPEYPTGPADRRRYREREQERDRGQARGR